MLDRVGPHDELVMVRAEMRGHRARAVELVERGLVEANREGADRPADASAMRPTTSPESRPPDRNAPNGTSLTMMRPHRMRQRRVQLIDGIVFGAAELDFGRQHPVAERVTLVGVQRRMWPGGSLRMPRKMDTSRGVYRNVR